MSHQRIDHLTEARQLRKNGDRLRRQVSFRYYAHFRIIGWHCLGIFGQMD